MKVHIHAIDDLISGESGGKNMKVSGSPEIAFAFEPFAIPVIFPAVILTTSEREDIGTGEREGIYVKSIYRKATVSLTEQDLSNLFQLLSTAQFVSLDNTVALQLAVKLIQHALSPHVRPAS